jgi:hypothetical protein
MWQIEIFVVHRIKFGHVVALEKLEEYAHVGALKKFFQKRNLGVCVGTEKQKTLKRTLQLAHGRIEFDFPKTKVCVGGEIVHHSLDVHVGTLKKILLKMKQGGMCGH